MPDDSAQELEDSEKLGNNSDGSEALEPPFATIGDFYSRGFNHLVSDPNDVEQLVAYGRYKALKIEWAAATKPNKNQLDDYHFQELAAPGKKEMYHDQASQMVFAYMEQMVERDKDEIISPYIQEYYTEEIREHVESLEKAQRAISEDVKEKYQMMEAKLKDMEGKVSVKTSIWHTTIAQVAVILLFFAGWVLIESGYIAFPAFKTAPQQSAVSSNG